MNDGLTRQQRYYRANRETLAAKARANRERTRELERARYRATKTHPEPIPQPSRPDLPPLGHLVGDDDGSRLQCHVCGGFYRRIGTHAKMGHGLDGNAYREQFALNRTVSLDAPAYQQNNRDRAIARGIGDPAIGETYAGQHAPTAPMPLQGKLQRSRANRRLE